MNCPKCGTVNMEGSSYCIKCGINMLEQQNQSSSISNSVSIQNESSIGQNVNMQAVSSEIQNQPISINNAAQQFQSNMSVQQVQQPIQGAQQVQQPTQSIVTNAPLNYLMYIIAILLKPFKSFKEEEQKLTNTKTAIIFTIIVSIGVMLINLIKTVIMAVITKNMDYTTYKMKTVIDFGNLEKLDWLSLIGKNLIIYAGIIIAIAIVYYIVGLVFKKSVSFIKLLAISTTSVIPYIVLGMIISPLLGKIWGPLSIVAMVVGAAYSILILISLINDCFEFDSQDKKIYFHLICLTILGVAGYYAYMKLSISEFESQMNDILDMFN